MKKLITGAVATLALLFGFASCSGDLHDNDVLPLTIVGITADAGNHVIPMTLDKADGSEQSLTFTLKDGFELTARDGKKYKLSSNPKDSWRGSDPLTALHFKVIPGDAVKADGTPDWTMDFASLNKEDPQYIKAGEDFQKVGKRGDANVSGDPKHLILDGAIEGETYVLRAKYNAAAGTLELKLDGRKNDPAGVRFIFADDYKNFPKKDDAEKDLSYSMAKAGDTYIYQFVSVEDETISFHLKNAMAGTLGGSLSTTAANLIVNAETVTNMSLTVKKNVEYKITVDTAAGISKPTIKYEVVDMLKDATVNANWKYADAASAYAEKITSDSYQFFAEREEIDFTVLRHDGGVWGKHNVGTFNIDSDAVELAYSTAKDAAKATTVKVKGLAVGTCYKVVLEKNNDDFTLKAKVVTVPLADLTGKKFKGAFDGWDEANDWKGFDFTKQSDGTWTVDFTVTKAQEDSYEFGIYGDGDDKWCHEEEIKADGEYHEIGYAGNNCKMSGVTSGKTYTFIVKPGYGKIEAKIVEK